MMRTSGRLLVTVAAAFAGGYLAGLLFAPLSGRQSRSAIAQRARSQSQRLEQQLHALEERLLDAEQQLEEAGHQFSERVRDATHRAMGHYVPTFDEEEVDWDVHKGEITRDLRRMPRG